MGNSITIEEFLALARKLQQPCLCLSCSWQGIVGETRGTLDEALCPNCNGETARVGKEPE